MKEPFLGTSKRKSALPRDYCRKSTLSRGYCYITIYTHRRARTLFKGLLQLMDIHRKVRTLFRGPLQLTERRELDRYNSRKGENPINGTITIHGTITVHGKERTLFRDHQWIHANSGKGRSTRKANEHGMTIQHGLWVTIITRHADRRFTETHYCARQLCVHGLWVEVHFCTRQQDALQGIKGYSLWICSDTEGELNMEDYARCATNTGLTA